MRNDQTSNENQRGIRRRKKPQLVFEHTHTHTHKTLQFYSWSRWLHLTCHRTSPVPVSRFQTHAFPVPRNEAGSGQCHRSFNTCRSSEHTCMQTCLLRTYFVAFLCFMNMRTVPSLLFSFSFLSCPSPRSERAKRERESVEEGNDVSCMANRRWSNRWKQPAWAGGGWKSKREKKFGELKTHSFQKRSRNVLNVSSCCNFAAGWRQSVVNFIHSWRKVRE